MFSDIEEKNKSVTLQVKYATVPCSLHNFIFSSQDYKMFSDSDLDENICQRKAWGHCLPPDMCRMPSGP